MDITSCFGFNVSSAVRIGLLLVVGVPVVRFFTKVIAQLCYKRFSHHSSVLLSHIVFYGGMVFIGVNILHECGFNVTAVLGAAGIVGVALGFASQTSISNIISGFFLLLERPFSVGDKIKSGDVIGVAESIDLLAVRVRTDDNRLVRIPNETVLKHHLVNITYYPVRRIDFLLSVPYDCSFEQVESEIKALIEKESLFLASPLPIVLMVKSGQLSYDAQIRLFICVRVWVKQEDYTQATSHFVSLVKDMFDAQGIVVTVERMN